MLNDRKAKQIAAGKAAGFENAAYGVGKTKLKREAEADLDDFQEDFKEASEANPSSPRQNFLSTSPTAMPSEQLSKADASRKRKRENEMHNIDTALLNEGSGTSSKRAKHTPAPPAVASNTNRRKTAAKSTAKLSSSVGIPSQGGPPPMQHFSTAPGAARKVHATGYGNPPAGQNYGAPYYAQQGVNRRLPGQQYPDIQGWETPSMGYSLQNTFPDDNTASYNRVQSQQHDPSAHRGRAATDTTLLSVYAPTAGYGASSTQTGWQQPSRKRSTGEAGFEDDNHDPESTLPGPGRKRRRPQAHNPQAHS